MAAPAGGIELPLYTRLDDREYELGTITIPISTRLEADEDGGALMVVQVGGE
ncbi:hypothetical protein GCM10022234_00270 [Aeromicrobium panaciterrae]|uniref:hypothetical protein n=1 Tax=Aeromicrobium panaciterrae TaxID=363861 RepID=UPI0031E26552